MSSYDERIETWKNLLLKVIPKEAREEALYALAELESLAYDKGYDLGYDAGEESGYVRGLDAGREADDD